MTGQTQEEMRIFSNELKHDEENDLHNKQFLTNSQIDCGINVEIELVE